MSNETPYEAAEDVVCTSYLKSKKLCNKWVIKGTVESITDYVTKTDIKYTLVTFAHDLDHKVELTNGKDVETYSAEDIKFVLKQIYDRKETDFIEKIIREYLVSVGCREPEYGIKYFHNFNSIMVWERSNYKIDSSVTVGSKVAVSVIDNQISVKSNGELNFVNHRVCSDVVQYEQNPDLVTTIRKSNDKRVSNNNNNSNPIPKDTLAQSNDAELFQTPPRVKRTNIGTLQPSSQVVSRKVYKTSDNISASIAKVINYDDDNAIDNV